MAAKLILTLAYIVPAIAQTVTCSYKVVASNGDTCASVASSWGLTESGFESLNPGVVCPTLVVGQSYCVLGKVTTSSSKSSSSSPTTSSTSSKTVTTPSTSSTAPPTTLTPSTTSSTTSSSGHEPTQPGLAANCNNFYLVQSGDTCITIESKYGITATEFYTWNPAIDSSKLMPQANLRPSSLAWEPLLTYTPSKACSNLFLDYYWVCVGVPGATTTSSSAAPTPTGPTPQMPGIVSNCADYYLVASGDTCEKIDSANGITLTDFLSWNTDVDANCDNLWLGYYVCVGV
ncbi:hypothetical protein VMCG_04275 [Cytospora schulzeri]|uniref:LysM domain-containing protein n=1 Tax=Cytospora schulzeri TaxID=448051 RepID=A0A423WSN6_9PEZI|nr:hypothetical protein VMCG_04275 [Valsa malicola]